MMKVTNKTFTMKKAILSAMVLASVFIACNSNNDTTKEITPEKSTTTDTMQQPNMNPVAEQLYTCSMHPEVTGKKDEKCSKCGMKLTVPVKKSETPG